MSKHAGIIDCDVHPTFTAGLRDLIPYLSSPIRQRIDFMLSSPWGQSRFGVANNTLYMNPGGLLRRDAAVDGVIPGSDPIVLGQHFLDPYNVSRAILIITDVLGLGAMPDNHVSTAIASASNDWLADKWLSRDERFRGTIAIAPRDPAHAVAEIERHAGDPRFVQVFFPLTDALMGDNRFYPIYEAAEEFQLPIVLHPGPEMIYRSGAGPAGGVPSYYLEWHALLGQPFAANVASFLIQPVLQKFPKMKLVVAEAGCGWVPDLIWRLDRDWMSVRDEVPWVTERPSRRLFDHVRFTTQPFVETEKPSHVSAFCEMIHGNETLLFSSDYPHWDFDDPNRVFAGLDDEIVARIIRTNALEFYGDRISVSADGTQTHGTA